MPPTISSRELNRREIHGGSLLETMESWDDRTNVPESAGAGGAPGADAAGGPRLGEGERGWKREDRTPSGAPFRSPAGRTRKAQRWLFALDGRPAAVTTLAWGYCKRIVSRARVRLGSRPVARSKSVSFRATAYAGGGDGRRRRDRAERGRLRKLRSRAGDTVYMVPVPYDSRRANRAHRRPGLDRRPSLQGRDDWLRRGTGAGWSGARPSERRGVWAVQPPERKAGLRAAQTLGSVPCMA